MVLSSCLSLCTSSETGAQMSVLVKRSLEWWTTGRTQGPQASRQPATGRRQCLKQLANERRNTPSGLPVAGQRHGNNIPNFSYMPQIGLSLSVYCSYCHLAVCCLLQACPACPERSHGEPVEGLSAFCSFVSSLPTQEAIFPFNGDSLHGDQLVVAHLEDPQGGIGTMVSGSKRNRCS